MAPKIAPGDPVTTDPAPYPSKDIHLIGKHVTIVGISPSHAEAMFLATKGPSNESLFIYLFDGPYDSVEAYQEVITKQAADNISIFYTILLNSTNSAVGRASLLNISTANRSVEVGNILFSPLLQRTPAATEAQYLLADYVFKLGYRRYEWKCNSLNEPSKRAALRLGFKYEGLFRQHVVQRGRSRDTWWASLLDWEWEPEEGGGVKKAYGAWLADENFDAEGKQKKRLEESS
jgi:RimJ/RimL family protein N-acetyltransferase